MVRLKVILIAAVIGLSTNANAQERDWKITSALSFAPGLLTEKTQTIQLHGYLGFLKNKIHLRGDAFYFLNSYGQRPRFDMNHQIYAGAFYHFTDTQFQPYVGFQPGIAIARSSEYQTLNETTGELEAKIATSPVGSAVGGFSYYGEKLFFLFFETRYIFGQHKSNTYPVYLDELRFSFGLGFFF
ncbi:hypothetical protein K6119_13715 [Paracrocinitomix mangrovi]|uniref:hypothetical protein n=1 Tax=Paracrocinitomix mangrovi TaxID=2862509 RepID=UPI001C8F037B|nr:hypothetical protein [Paracrocinitomix mangrovi]UKN00786.1 hypothetical protein K6119_13715 [Paracrocinitomix mangrovi]